MINIFSIEILEPSTLITDLLLGILALFLGRKLFEIKNNDWGYFLVFMGLSAIAGGLGHGFYYFYGIYIKMFSWILLNVSFYFAEKETLNLLSIKNRKNLKILFVIKLILLSVLAIYFESFTYIKISAIVGLLGFVMITNIIKSFHTTRKYLVYGILISVSSVFIHWKKIAISEEWFNHNDISHIVTIVSILYMYKGVKKLNLASS